VTPTAPEKNRKPTANSPTSPSRGIPRTCGVGLL
jgi:hypothetical protein